MESLGVSSTFLCQEFENAVSSIRGLPDRYANGTETREDQRLTKAFATVSWSGGATRDVASVDKLILFL